MRGSELESPLYVDLPIDSVLFFSATHDGSVQVSASNQVRATAAQRAATALFNDVYRISQSRDVYTACVRTDSIGSTTVRVPPRGQSVLRVRSVRVGFDATCS